MLSLFCFLIFHFVEKFTYTLRGKHELNKVLKCFSRFYLAVIWSCVCVCRCCIACRRIDVDIQISSKIDCIVSDCKMQKSSTCTRIKLMILISAYTHLPLFDTIKDMHTDTLILINMLYPSYTSPVFSHSFIQSMFNQCILFWWRSISSFSLHFISVFFSDFASVDTNS